MGPNGLLSLRHYGASPGSHSHDHFQILLGLSGALDLEVAGRGVRVAPGDGCVIAPGDRHDFESTRGSVCLVLDSAHADCRPNNAFLCEWGVEYPVGAVFVLESSGDPKNTPHDAHVFAVHNNLAVLLQCQIECFGQ